MNQLGVYAKPVGTKFYENYYCIPRNSNNSILYQWIENLQEALVSFNRQSINLCQKEFKVIDTIKRSDHNKKELSLTIEAIKRATKITISRNKKLVIKNIFSNISEILLKGTAGMHQRSTIYG